MVQPTSCCKSVSSWTLKHDYFMKIPHPDSLDLLYVLLRLLLQMTVMPLLAINASWARVKPYAVTLVCHSEIWHHISHPPMIHSVVARNANTYKMHASFYKRSQMISIWYNIYDWLMRLFVILTNPYLISSVFL